MGTWESIFKTKGKFFYQPHEDMERLVRILRQNKSKRVFDLGCGSGRHTVFFAKNGFDVYGMDNSRSGLEQTRDWLKKSRLRAQLKNASCYKRFPYADDSFDAIISVQVIHHAKISDIRGCISEMRRVLKPGGIIFISVPKNKKDRFRSKVKMIAPRTFVPLDGHEVGVPHYHFNKGLLRREFEGFKVMELYVDTYSHYCLLAKAKKK